MIFTVGKYSIHGASGIHIFQYSNNNYVPIFQYIYNYIYIYIPSDFLKLKPPFLLIQLLYFFSFWFTKSLPGWGPMPWPQPRFYWSTAAAKKGALVSNRPETGIWNNVKPILWTCSAHGKCCVVEIPSNVKPIETVDVVAHAVSMWFQHGSNVGNQQPKACHVFRRLLFLHNVPRLVHSLLMVSRPGKLTFT